MKRMHLLVIPALIGLAACESPIAGPTISAPASPFAMLNTLTGDPQAGTNAVFPSTNDANYNKAEQWSHVLWVETPEVIPEQLTLNFVQPRSFAACFEYRIDDEPPTGLPNFNPSVPDRFAFTCQNASSAQMTFNGMSHIDVRLAFGAESDERFDWTRFYFLSLDNKDQCKNGSWETLGFANQGLCVRYVETGKDSR